METSDHFRPEVICSAETYVAEFGVELRTEYAAFLALTPRVHNRARAQDLLLIVFAFFEQQGLEPVYTIGIKVRVRDEIEKRAQPNCPSMPPMGAGVPALTRYIAWRIKYQHEANTELFITYASIIESLYLQLQESGVQPAAARAIEKSRQRKRVERINREERGRVGRIEQERVERAERARMEKAEQQYYARRSREAAKRAAEKEHRAAVAKAARLAREAADARIDTRILKEMATLSEVSGVEIYQSRALDELTYSFGTRKSPLPTLDELDAGSWEVSLDRRSPLPVWTPITEQDSSTLTLRQLRSEQETPLDTVSGLGISDRLLASSGLRNRFQCYARAKIAQLRARKKQGR